MTDFALNKAVEIVRKLNVLYGDIEFLFVDGLSENDEFLLGEAQNGIEEAVRLIEDVCSVSRFDSTL